MVRNRFLLGSLAFGLSFGISLVTTRDAGKAFTTGLTTLPAAVIASIIVDRRWQEQANSRIAAMKSQIRALQKRRSEIYQSLVAMQAGRDQAIASPDAISLQPHPLHLPAARPRPPQKPLSWNLSSSFKADPVVPVQPHNLPTELQPLPNRDRISSKAVPQSDPATEKQVAEATARQRQLEASLKSLQTERDQLQTQVDQQRKTRDRLTRELSDLEQQKRRLQTDSSSLKQEIDTLKRRQKELNEDISRSEVKKREMEAATQPLNASIKQLQTQASTLQEELHRLEIQISDRRQQKADLENQLATLQVQQAQLQPPVEAPPLPTSNGKNGRNHPVTRSDSPPAPPEATARPAQTVVATPPKVVLDTRPTKKPEAATSSKPAAEMSDEWTEFMLSLPEYEVMVLRAIVEQHNPAAVIKTIAEDNLTMPELLIDSINERALELLGDMVIEPGKSAGSATIAREHAKTIKKLIKTYEYLSE